AREIIEYRHAILGDLPDAAARFAAQAVMESAEQAIERLRPRGEDFVVDGGRARDTGEAAHFGFLHAKKSHAVRRVAVKWHIGIGAVAAHELAAADLAPLQALVAHVADVIAARVLRDYDAQVHRQAPIDFFEIGVVVARDGNAAHPRNAAALFELGRYVAQAARRH